MHSYKLHTLTSFILQIIPKFIANVQWYFYFQVSRLPCAIPTFQANDRRRAISFTAVARKYPRWSYSRFRTSTPRSRALHDGVSKLVNLKPIVWKQAKWGAYGRVSSIPSTWLILWSLFMSCFLVVWWLVCLSGIIILILFHSNARKCAYDWWFI